MDNIISNQNDDNMINNRIYNKKSKKGLSAGSIIAIIIPIVVVLIVTIALIFILGNSKTPKIKLANTNETLYNLNIQKK